MATNQHEIILSLFDSEKKEAVREYLQKNQQVAPFLFEISTAINKYFPKYKAPKLCLVKDPDIANFEMLYIYIPYDCAIKEAYGKFKQFKKEWLYPHYEKIRGFINVDLDYK